MPEKKMTANYQIVIGYIIVAVCAVGAVFGSIMVKHGYAEKNSGHSESSHVQQQTEGANSPNINAPNAKTVEINYGIPEKVFTGWIKQLTQLPMFAAMGPVISCGYLVIQ